MTATFNRNLLARINRELGANFTLAHFVHQAIFNHRTHSVEMHLRSRDEQTVTIPGADLVAATTGVVGKETHQVSFMGRLGSQ